jgi:hypothetical protein
MTSRQPGTTPPGTTPPGTTPPGTTPPGTTPPGTTGRTGTPWPLVLPLALLIILALAGLRGVAAQPRWNGPLHQDGVVVGLALEVVLGVLLVVTVRRRSAGLNADPVNLVAVKLRSVLIFLLGTGMAAVAVGIVLSQHLHLPKVAAKQGRAPPQPTTTRLPRGGSQSSATIHFPVAALLYALLIVVLLAAVVLSIWWARRLRPAVGARKDGFIAEDPEDLRDAVESGRSALRTLDDARAAIIACYVAMENSLAERGAARAAADTPDELLARATRSGLVRGTAAARLTALFYEARFSSHPLDRRHRDAAGQALDELAAALAAAERAGRAGRAEGAGPAEPAEPAGAGA